MRLADVHTPAGQDPVELVGAALGGVLGNDVGGGDLPETLHGSFVAVQQPRGQDLLERHGQGNVTDTDQRRRPAAGAVFTEPVVGGQREDLDGGTDPLEAG